MRLIRSWIPAATVAVLLASAVSAGSDFPSIPAGKPGLYEARNSSNFAIFIARNMSKTPPEEQARLSAEALARPGPVLQLCVAAGSTKVFEQFTGRSPECTASNTKTTDRGFSADVTCGRGASMHLDLVTDGPEHRVLTTTRPAMPGATVKIVSKVDIRWISSNCGALKPGEAKPLSNKPDTVR